MPLTRKEKEAWVTNLKSGLENASCAFIVSYKGLTVENMTEIRSKLREIEANFQVTRNRLTKLALDGTDFEELKDFFKGTTAVAYGDHPVEIAKVFNNFSKENEKLEIIGGAMGSEIMDVKGVKTLASLPSQDELRAKIISIIQTPARNLVGVTEAPAEQIARLTHQFNQKTA
jgi:large subunit ribosomal protein L10